MGWGGFNCKTTLLPGKSFLGFAASRVTPLLSSVTLAPGHILCSTPKLSPTMTITNLSNVIMGQLPQVPQCPCNPSPRTSHLPHPCLLCCLQSLRLFPMTSSPTPSQHGGLVTP